MAIKTIKIEAKPREEKTPSHQFFSALARKTATGVGTPWAFLIAVLIVAVWAISGPMFGFSDTWQLVINTGTTIVTFLMVFLIQNTQNRDAKAMQLKLDELIVALAAAHNQMIDIETLSDEELTKLEQQFHKLRDECAAAPSAHPDLNQ